MKRSQLKAKPETQRAWQERTRLKQIAKQRENPTPGATLKPHSAKRAKQNRAYSAKRKVHLKANPFCKKCGTTATEVHHSKGRTGNLLTDERYFVSLCHDCHVWTTANYQEAVALGLSATRFNNEELL